MTLKEELEILRGEPIQVFTGDPMDIPCIETSDLEKLCKHPVVSVCMITYNHEPYIRQAIEGVMMQKTDFEFELVIGEDCSTDKTREICFEYQKKHPDKIRVLWAKENVSKKGGNGRRVRARCRGEFIALCEGDDYWTDSLKLQKQVDIFRKYDNVNLCCHHFMAITNKGIEDWTKIRLEELISSGKNRSGFLFTRDEYFTPSMLSQTAAVMYRKSAFDQQLAKKIGIMYDWVLSYIILSNGFGYYINETMSMYRFTSAGVWSSMSGIEQIRWSLSRAIRVYDADPTSVSKQQYDYWRNLLRQHCSADNEFMLIKSKIRNILHRLRMVQIIRMIRGIK